MVAADAIGLWGVPIAVLGGAVRVSTPFLFVSLGECITEKSGRINLGLEGILVMGAMSGYAFSDIAGGIGLMLFGTGLAFLLGKPYVQPKAPTLPAMSLGSWSGSPPVQAALEVNPLFL